MAGPSVLPAMDLCLWHWRSRLLRLRLRDRRRLALDRGALRDTVWRSWGSQRHQASVGVVSIASGSAGTCQKRCPTRSVLSLKLKHTACTHCSASVLDVSFEMLSQNLVDEPCHYDALEDSTVSWKDQWAKSLYASTSLVFRMSSTAPGLSSELSWPLFHGTPLHTSRRLHSKISQV